MSKFLMPVALSLLAVFTLPSHSRADEAADMFNQLFGDDLKRVQATPSTADDLALARQLLDAARKAEKQSEFLALLCEKAYELAARDPGGQATATEAMTYLAEKVPSKKVACLQKCVALCQKQYATARTDAKAKTGETLIGTLRTLAEAQAAAGDTDTASATLRQALAVAMAIKSPSKAEVQARLDGMGLGQKIERQIAAFQANPGDAALRKELVRLLLVETDNPAEAARFLNESLDESTRKYVPAAAKPTEEAPEAAAKELGDWYRTLADQAASPAAKGAMLRRAQGYYERFLMLHTSDDLARTGAVLLLKKVEDALAKVPASAASAAAWVDALAGVDLRRDVVNGNWALKDARLSSLTHEAGSRVLLPVRPAHSYEMEIAFTRQTGNDTVAVCLPVGKTAVTLHLSAWNGALHGLSLVDGKHTAETPAAVRPGELVNGREYTANVTVLPDRDNVEIAVALDAKPLFRWKGPQASLTACPEFDLPDPACVGVGTWGCTAVFRRVRVRSLPEASKAIEAPARMTTTWIDCLRLVDPAKDKVTGEWQRRADGALEGRGGRECCLMIPCTTTGCYELAVTFSRLETAGDVRAILPVGFSRLLLCLSAGLGSTNDLREAKSGQTRSGPGNLVNNQDYSLYVKVLAYNGWGDVLVTLDDKTIMHWKGPQGDIEAVPYAKLPNPACPGLGLHETRVVFKSVRLRTLPGSLAKPLR